MQENTDFLNEFEQMQQTGFTSFFRQEPIPDYDEKRQILIPTERYDEANKLTVLGFEVREKDIQVLKEEKLKELKELKEEKLKFMPFKNTLFQIDSEAKINISGKISEIILKQSLASANLNAQNATTPNDENTFSWLDKDNATITFTQQEFLAFGISIAKYCEAVIFKHDELRKRVLAANSYEELQSIEWEE